MSSQQELLGNKGLRLPVHLPEWYGQLSDEQTIKYINEQMTEMVYMVAVGRWVEWNNIDSPFDNDSVDMNRRKIGYYARARETQERADILFKAIRPSESIQLNSQLGDIDDRWFHTQHLVRLVSNILEEPRREDFRVPLFVDPMKNLDDMLTGNWPAKPKKFIVHGRAKSNFSCWAKMFYHHINTNEIFDLIGTQVLVENDEHAREIHEKILKFSQENPQVFKLMESRPFARQAERTQAGLPLTSNPTRDYLDKPSSKYRSIRSNYVDSSTGTIFEIQVTPINVYAPPIQYMTQLAVKANRQDPRSQAGT